MKLVWGQEILFGGEDIDTSAAPGVFGPFDENAYVDAINAVGSDASAIDSCISIASSISGKLSGLHFRNCRW